MSAIMNFMLACINLSWTIEVEVDISLETWEIFIVSYFFFMLYQSFLISCLLESRLEYYVTINSQPMPCGKFRSMTARQMEILSPNI